jgi:hypothetical protein
MFLVVVCNVSGDVMPNTDGHIHLEKQAKKGIWEEYCGDFEYRGRPPLSYGEFCRLWRDSFPHVKIRSYKQVSGKKAYPANPALANLCVHILFGS